MTHILLARLGTGIVVLLVLLSHMSHISHITISVAAAPPALQASPATPIPAGDDAGSLGAMLRYLPDCPLGAEGAMVVYANIAAQAAALGVAAPGGPDDVARRQAWVTAVMPPMLPQTTGARWVLPEWRETFGFDLFQVEQAVEYAAPPFGVTVVRGSFDPDELRAAWARGGYQPVDLGVGEAYAVREDHEVDFSDPGSRMALAYLNVVALAGDGTLIFSSTRDGVRDALAAAAGERPSFAERVEIAPIVDAAPADLVAALLVSGDLLHATPDPAAILGEEAPEAIATRVAEEQADARSLPPVAAALLGQTAGALPAQSMLATPVTAPDVPPARLVVVLTSLSPGMAEHAAAVLAARLATERTPTRMEGRLADRPWAELFPERSVEAMPGEPAVRIELLPAPDVPPFFLQTMLFQRTPGFLAWLP